MTLLSFLSRLKSLLDIVEQLNRRAETDQKAYDVFVSNHPVSIMSSKGYTQWKGSTSRKHAMEDINNQLHKEEKGWRGLWESRDIYKQEFPVFEAFRDKCKQEIKTSKYLYTIKVLGRKRGGEGRLDV